LKLPPALIRDKKVRPAAEEITTYQNTSLIPALFLSEDIIANIKKIEQARESLLNATLLHIADVERNRVVGAM
jgi:hypothetical protein